MIYDEITRVDTGLCINGASAGRIFHAGRPQLVMPGRPMQPWRAGEFDSICPRLPRSEVYNRLKFHDGHRTVFYVWSLWTTLTGHPLISISRELVMSGVREPLAVMKLIFDQCVFADPVLNDAMDDTRTLVALAKFYGCEQMRFGRSDRSVWSRSIEAIENNLNEIYAARICANPYVDEAYIPLAPRRNLTAFEIFGMPIVFDERMPRDSIGIGSIVRGDQEPSYLDGMRYDSQFIDRPERSRQYDLGDDMPTPIYNGQRDFTPGTDAIGILSDECWKNNTMGAPCGTTPDPSSETGLCIEHLKELRGRYDDEERPKRSTFDPLADARFR